MCDLIVRRFTWDSKLRFWFDKKTWGKFTKNGEQSSNVNYLQNG